MVWTFLYKKTITTTVTITIESRKKSNVRMQIANTTIAANSFVQNRKIDVSLSFAM